jgi:hypothetical protein
MKNRVINSTAFLFAAYFIVHFTSLISQYIILKLFNVRDVVLYFFYNTYSAPAESFWTKIKVFLIFGIGQFMVFMVLMLVLILFFKLSRRDYKLTVFYNWLILVCAAFIISAVFGAPFFREASSLYIVLLWMRFEAGAGGMYVLAIMSLPLIPLVAFFVRRPFLQMSNTTKWIKTKSLRLQFYFFTAIIPFLILSLILSLFIFYLYSYPIINAVSNEGMRLLILGAILFLGAIFSYNKKYLSIHKSNTVHISNTPLVVLIIVIIFSVYTLLWLNLT